MPMDVSSAGVTGSTNCTGQIYGPPGIPPGQTIPSDGQLSPEVFVLSEIGGSTDCNGDVI